MSGYFEKFPLISYSNNIVTNILAKVVFTEVAKKTTTTFYPYIIENGERPDLIAENYYGDSKYSWVVYLSNYLIDPYYEWPLNENEFKEYIVSKYGTVDKATKTVVCYNVNWEGDQSIINTSGYTALPANLKKYWKPIEGVTGIAGYERAKLNLSIETNKTISLKISNTSGLATNDLIYQYTTSNTLFAKGYIKTITGNTAILQHITGAFVPSGNTVVINSNNYTAGVIRKELSNYTSNVTSVTTLKNSLPENELIYWEEVNAFDYETLLNDSRKNIQLLDRSYLEQVENELSNLL